VVSYPNIAEEKAKDQKV